MSEALAITDEAELFNDADYARGIQERTKRRAKAFFHGRGFERLLIMADSADDNVAMRAINTIGKLAGEFKAPRPVVLSFDELQKRATAAPGGLLSDITQIREAEILDADEERDEDSTTE